MRTFEYALIAILIGVVVIYGATKVSAAISGSFNNSAAILITSGR